MSEVRRFAQEPEKVAPHDWSIAQRLKNLIPHADSDFDLLVVLRHLSPSESRSYQEGLYRALRGSGVTAGPWVMSEEEFQETRRRSRPF